VIILGKGICGISLIAADKSAHEFIVGMVLSGGFHGFKAKEIRGHWVKLEQRKFPPIKNQNE
jgi:hypothetical protein